MPLFEISHAAPLTDGQKSQIAQAMTELQCRKFGTPSTFVTIVFDATAKSNTYVAGKPHPLNIIHVTFRDGPMHTQAQFDSLCVDLQKIWEEIVCAGYDTKPPPELVLRVVYVTGGILSASECGFVVPKPGKEKEWAMENMEAFKQKAREGDEDIIGLLKELQSRQSPAM